MFCCQMQPFNGSQFTQTYFQSNKIIKKKNSVTLARLHQDIQSSRLLFVSRFVCCYFEIYMHTHLAAHRELTRESKIKKKFHLFSNTALSKQIVVVVVFYILMMIAGPLNHTPFALYNILSKKSFTMVGLVHWISQDFVKFFFLSFFSFHTIQHTNLFFPIRVSKFFSSDDYISVNFFIRSVYVYNVLKIENAT